jgi:hypothetical protein
MSKRAAYLRKPLFAEPAIANAAVHRPAIGLQLVSADMVMTALVMKDEQPNALRVALEKRRIDDE